MQNIEVVLDTDRYAKFNESAVPTDRERKVRFEEVRFKIPSIFENFVK